MFDSKDLTDFISPLRGRGKEHFREFCKKHDLDFESNFQNLTKWFETFPQKIHVQAAHRHCYMSWWDWLFLAPKILKEECGAIN